MAGGPLEHLHADTRVRTRVADAAHLQGGEAAGRIAARQVLETDRVPLGVDEEALLTREGALHRAVQQPRRQRCLTLVAHVLLATERATVRHEFDGDLVVADCEQRGDLVAVVPHALTTRVDVQVTAAVVAARRHCQRALRLEEGVLDALGLEHLVHGVRTGSQGCIHVATAVGAHRQHVAVGAPHGRLGVVDSGHRIGDRAQHLVLHLDQLRRVAGLLLGLCHHDGEHIARVTGALTLADEHRPVLVDDADELLARDVGLGEDSHHAGSGERPAGVD